jgi:2-polyprenyl-3-methyl-5-hydroxy-6-metoxy-1,4-benzoquinol methylase
MAFAVQDKMSSDFDARGKRIGLFVVAYDAESRIEDTLSRVPESVWRALTVVYVIDDASLDETVEKALSFQSPWKDKVVVLRNRVNQRYGGLQKLGYQYALDHGLDAIATLHADGQYAPELLPELLGPVCREEAEVVIGSRMLERGKALQGGMPRYKYAGNILLTRIQNALCGTRLSEFHSGYRAYSTSFLRGVPFWENSDEWHFDSQVLMQAACAGARVREIAIPTYYGDEIRHVNGIAYGIDCILASVKFWLHRRGVVYSRGLDVSVRGRRYFEKFNDPMSSHSVILKHLEGLGLRGRKVLELGVGDASLTRRMHEQGAVVDGIELDALSADLARPYCRRVIVHNLDDFETLDLNEKYDVILAADVLEHLRDPQYVLSRLKKFSHVGTLLVVSLPNIVNLYVRLNVMLGRFPTHSKGLLDRTHLHAFTLGSAGTLLFSTGWVIQSSAVTAIPLPIVFPFLVKWPFRLALVSFHAATRMLRGLLAYQGIFYCRNPNKDYLL